MSLERALPQEGDVVAGKYRIEKIVGEGGMGIVYAAHHLILDQRVALKLLLVDSPSGDETVERFVREAQAAARLRSEHVVRVTDAGALDNGLPFLVMEYLQGCDLAELLRLEGPLQPEDVADYVLQVLAALAEAHAAGIVHRDLKPANLFLALRADGSNIIKILDFGISKQKSERTHWKELTGKAVLGTPNYMSPEQLRSSKNVDARADIWSIGIVMYELLSGALPFDGEGPGEIFAAILEQTPTSLRTHCPGLPPAWEDAVTRCLQRAPESRFSDVSELARAIVPLGSGRFAHLIAAIEQALARGPRSGSRTNTALLNAAVAAAITSMPPPRALAGSNPSKADAVESQPLPARRSRRGASANLATDKTLLAEVLPARSESATRRPIRAMASAIAVAAACVFGFLAMTGRAASRAESRVAVSAAAAPALPPPPPAAIAPVSPAPAVPDRVESQSQDMPEPVTPVSSASPKSAPPADARHPRPLGGKKAAPDARPTFLKSWR